MRPRLAINDPTKIRIDALHFPEAEKRKKLPRGKPFAKGNCVNPHGRKGKNGDAGKSKKMSLWDKRRQIIAESGLTPLEFLLSVVRDPFAHVDYRIEASKAAAPYVHRKMPIAIEGGDPTKPIVFEASALSMLAPQEKMLLLTLVEKMALAMQPQGKKPWEKIIEGVAAREAESDDDAPTAHRGNGEDKGALVEGEQT